MPMLPRPAALVLAGAFAIAACAQPPTAPATPAPKATPPAAATPAADASVSNPIKDAPTMPQPAATEPEYGPAIPAAQLRKRILDLIGSFRSLKDLESENVEHITQTKLIKRPTMSDGYQVFGITTEGWTYRIGVSRLSRMEDPPTILIDLDNGVEAWTNQQPAYCTLAFEPLAKELVAMGYERDPRAYTRGGDMIWGFGKDVTEQKAGFGIEVVIYELKTASGPSTICVETIRIGGGVYNG